MCVYTFGCSVSLPFSNFWAQKKFKSNFRNDDTFRILLYMNDIAKVSHLFIFINYADDSTLSSTLQIN